MAKTDAFNADTRKRVTARELKLELKRLVEAIVGDEENGDGVCEDQASKVLSALKEMKLRKSESISLGSVCVPEEFRCPISKQLMGDPVILSSGKTYDRPFIQKYLKEGHGTCPLTQQVLSHTILTPNLLVGEMISKWCMNNGIAPPKPVAALDDELVTDAERDRLKLLLEKMSSSLPVQKDAAKELRLLTKRMPSFRALFGQSADAIPQLLNPLSPGGGVDTADSDLQEDLITTVLNLSIHDSNKKLVGESPIVIPLLIESLKGKTVEIKRNAAAALFTLSALDLNKQIIGQQGAMQPLIELLDEGHPLAIKDAASAIFNLCILSENKVRAIRDGAIQAILKKIRDKTLVEELLAILAMLSGHPKSVEEMCANEAVGCLLSILRESHCERNKENCVVILYTICYYNRSQLRQVREEEDDFGTISKVAQFGTSRAQRKASGILERLHKVTSVTHTT
uniref:RING-type E3 ubiquitin transferase n=1 Tax=Kalanchoe fedtschenkoi TaxID=63787 RepID=A0A7N0TEX2_KALFE